MRGGGGGVHPHLPCTSAFSSALIFLLTSRLGSEGDSEDGRPQLRSISGTCRLQPGSREEGEEPERRDQQRQAGDDGYHRCLAEIDGGSPPASPTIPGNFLGGLLSEPAVKWRLFTCHLPVDWEQAPLEVPA